MTGVGLGNERDVVDLNDTSQLLSINILCVSKENVENQSYNLADPFAYLLLHLPGCNIAWYDDSDPGPLFIVSSVVDSGLPKLTTTAFTDTCPWGSWVTSLSHKGPGTTSVMGVLQQDWSRGTELCLTAYVQLLGGKADG